MTLVANILLMIGKKFSRFHLKVQAPRHSECMRSEGWSHLEAGAFWDGGVFWYYNEQNS